MIRRLKIKFIILSMTSLLVLLAVIVAGMNVVNYHSVVKEADDVLAILSKNKGNFPEFDKMKDNREPPHFSPELPYESRFFSVLLNDSGDVIQVETSRIASVDTGKAIQYAQEIMNAKKERGFVEKFRFAKSMEENRVRVTFLDCGRKIDSFRDFLGASMGMAVGGLVMVFFAILFFAGRILRPVSESYEKQKRFITDAGHEIKTPLTIIQGNTDILEMELGSNECLVDIQQQVKRLTALTNDLVYLARMEESEHTLKMIEFSVSDVVYETGLSFRTLAQSQNKEFLCNIQPMLSMKGNESGIQQLVSILMDNALKYSPQGGTIVLSLKKQNRWLCLTVFNTTGTVLDKESLSHIFERFYRRDMSRNSETGGHGIGLSVAKAIVSAHGGKIQAWTRDGNSFQIMATFPL